MQVLSTDVAASKALMQHASVAIMATGRYLDDPKIVEGGVAFLRNLSATAANREALLAYTAFVKGAMVRHPDSRDVAETCKGFLANLDGSGV